MPKYKFVLWCDPLNIMVMTDVEAEDEFDAYEKVSTRVVRGAKPEHFNRIDYLGESKK